MNAIVRHASSQAIQSGTVKGFEHGAAHTALQIIYPPPPPPPCTPDPFWLSVCNFCCNLGCVYGGGGGGGGGGGSGGLSPFTGQSIKNA